MKEKNCLIFGGSGQIGRNIIRKLAKNNYKITVVTRNIHQKSYIIKTQANAGYIDIVEANIFDRDQLTKIIKNYIQDKEFSKISGPLICSDSAIKYREIFSTVCPDYSFDDFFISSDETGKTFNPQKLIDSGLMR